MSTVLRFFFTVFLAAHLAPFLSWGQPANLPPPDENKEIISLEQEKPAPRAPRRRARLPRGLHGRADAPIFGGNLVVPPDESVREVVLIGGNADIQGTVDRDLVVIGGNAKISGTVEGNVVVIGGQLDCSGQVSRDTVVVLGAATLADTARLERAGVFIGGPFDLSGRASIGQDKVVIPLGNVLPKIYQLKEWIIHGPLIGRVLPIGVKLAWMVAGFFLAIYFLAVIIFPRAVKAVYIALEEQPVASILSGLLTLILFAPLLVILAISIVGILAIPFVKIALFLALLFGKVGVICLIGRSLGRASGVSLLQAPLLAFLVGSLILLGVYMMPLFGLLAWAMATVFGLGGAVVALSRTFKREEANVPLARVSASNLRSNAPSSQPSSASATELPSGAGPIGVEAAAGGAAVGLMPPVFEGAIPNPADTLLLPRAGFWRRFLAALLDLILLLVLVPFLHIFFIPVAVAYFVGMWAWKGTSIGSLVMGLKIVRTDGEPVTFAVALVRCLSSFFSALVLFLGFFWIGWDRDKQGWHDKIAGTVVVRMPKDFALI